MKNLYQRSTVFFTIICLVVLMLNAQPRISLAQGDWDKMTSADIDNAIITIQQAIVDRNAKWKADKTSIIGLPKGKLTGAILHPEAEAVRTQTQDKGPLPLGLPGSFDWRNYNGHDWTTPIRDQGGCGSCYIFGTFAAAEGAMKVQAGTYGYLTNPDLSEQLPLSCTGFTCGGGYSGDVLDYLKNTGSTDEDCLPYTANDSTPCSNRCSNWDMRTYKIKNWEHPGGSWWPSVSQIKQAIYDYGPVSTYMQVYNDFFSYSSGVYEYVTGDLKGGHVVTLVGWNDTDQCWIAKNSWGTGWGENGWFRIKWGEVEIERQTEFVIADNLPNLTDRTPGGWSYPIVPRGSNDATENSCTIPSTLPGNSNTTYLNWAWTNNGDQRAPGHATNLFVDGIYRAWSTYNFMPVDYQGKILNIGTLNIQGGRHTLFYEIDANEQVWESNETYTDNCWGKQFVWSPYNLPDDAPVTRGTPPDKDGWGCANAVWYNNDGFSFRVQANHPNKWWSVVGILPQSTNADYDLRLWDIGSYTGSTGGFGGGYLKSSAYSGSTSDFVVVNDNTAVAGTYYAGVINYNAQGGNYRVEEDTSVVISPRPGTVWNGPYSKTDTNVLDIYEIYLSAGTYHFLLDQTSGSCDLGMTLYDDEIKYASKSQYMNNGYANNGGDGADESLNINIPDGGWHGLVVWKVDASDYGKNCTYRIGVYRTDIGGDINNDGTIDVLDLQLLVKCLIGAGSCSGSDLNGDGYHNIFDLQLMINKIIAP